MLNSLCKRKKRAGYFVVKVSICLKVKETRKNKRVNSVMLRVYVLEMYISKYITITIIYETSVSQFATKEASFCIQCASK
jgi:hypothetical protein